MTKFRKLTNYLEKNKWIFAAFLYVVLCVWIFFTADVEIEGIALDQYSAGVISLIAWHTMLLLAFAGAWLLSRAVDNIAVITEWFKEGREKRKTKRK